MRFVWVFIALLGVSGAAIAKDAPFYLSYKDEDRKLQEQLQRADNEGKLLALVIGAQWCHDSRALAGYFQSPELNDVTSSTITMMTLDVGYLTNKKPLLSQVGYPVYFATPTLLLIDPASKQVINRDSLGIWQSAHSQSADTLAEYLTTQYRYWQTGWSATPPVDAIAKFEKEQADRLYQEYAQLGPLLQKEDNGETVPGFNQQWRAVKQLRTTLQQDLIEMHKQGKIGDKSPNYAPIVW